MDCFTDIFPYDQAELLWKHITFLDDPNAVNDDEPLPSQSASQQGAFVPASELNRPKISKDIEGPDVFIISGWSEPENADDMDRRNRWKCWTAAHRPVVPRSTKSSVPAPEPPTSHSAMKVEIEDAGSSAGSEVASAASGENTKDYQHLIILELELEHDKENPTYSRQPFGCGSPATAGSRTSRSDNGIGTMAGDSSGGSGQGSSGMSSATTTTPVPAQSVDALGGQRTTPTPLTNAALQALADDTAAAMNETSHPKSMHSPPDPSPGSPETPPDPGTPSIVSVQEFGGSIDSDPSGGPSGLQGDNAWYPSIDDIYDSTTSRSTPIKALEKMRLMARGVGSAPRQSPDLRRVAASARSGRSSGRRPPSQPLGRGDAGSPAGSSVGSTSASPVGSFRSRGGPASMAAANNSVGTMDVFAVLAEVIEQLGRAPDLESLLKIVVGVIKDLTQFHRVLVYQFDDAWNGQVCVRLNL